MLRGYRALVDPVNLQPDALTVDVPSFRVPFAQRRDCVPRFSAVVQRAKDGADALVECLRQFLCLRVLLREAILKEAAVILRENRQKED